MRIVKYSIINVIGIFIMLTFSLIFGHAISVKADTTSNVGVSYQTHVQNIGWQTGVNDGQTAGAEAQNLRMEAVKINLNNAPAGMSISYQAHVQNIGWMNSVQAGQQAGTTGQDLRMEAIKIQLNNAPTGYHVKYQVYIQNQGWSDWIQDGQQAGTTGKGLMIEAIKIQIVKDTSSSASSSQTNGGAIKATYQTHVQNYGWQNWSNDGEIAGTTGEDLRIEAIKINAQNLQQGMGLQYQVQVQNIGWMSWVQAGQQAGTTGQGLRIEAIKIQLTGMSGYHVEYQAHVQNIGWMPWSQDGEIAGTVGRGLRMEAIRIRIVKDSPKSVTNKSAITAPSNNASFFNNQNATLTGYALNQYGNQEVDVYVDGAPLGKATTGLDSSSVNSGGYSNGSTSGYSCKLPINTMSNGTHTVTVQAIGNDLSLDNQTVSFNVKVLQPAICIDAPTGGTFINSQSGQLDVKGWSLNSFGVNKVQVYVNNNYISDATIGISRSDVNSSFPNYTNGANSGFDCKINYSSLPNGIDNLTVNSIGNDGVVTSQTIQIYKFANGTQIGTNYNETLQQQVNAQMSYGEPVKESGYSWVSADRNTVQYYVDPNNFMDNYGIYQFLRLDYMQGVTAADLNNILAGKGVLAGKGAQFLAAAQQYNINPVYLVSHALLETGNGTSTLSRGVSVNGRTTYNLFGIGAYDSNPITMGARYAYNQGWFSIDAAIYGGAKWISADYINNSSYKQNTLYKMRWNPASPANHQYATDVRWAYNQIYNIKKLVNMVQNPSLQFDIPIYKN